MSLTPEQRQLATYMSDISEDCYCAQWLSGLEYELWSILQDGQPCEYGNSDVIVAELAELKRLSDAIGGWIVWDKSLPWDADDDGCYRFVPMAEWLELYAKYQTNGPKVEDC